MTTTIERNKKPQTVKSTSHSPKKGTKNTFKLINIKLWFTVKIKPSTNNNNNNNNKTTYINTIEIST
jgi:hypothetical protein